MNVTALLEAIFNGLSDGSILILTALGLAITFGVMRVINMAHGEMLMLGAYTGYVVTDPDGLPRLVRGLGKLIGLELNTSLSLDLNLYYALPISFLVVGRSSRKYTSAPEEARDRKCEFEQGPNFVCFDPEQTSALRAYCDAASLC